MDNNLNNINNDIINLINSEIDTFVVLVRSLNNIDLSNNIDLDLDLDLDLSNIIDVSNRVNIINVDNLSSILDNINWELIFNNIDLSYIFNRINSSNNVLDISYIYYDILDNNIKNILSIDEFNKLSKKKFNNEEAIKECYNLECPINMKDFNNDDEIIILPCKHIFFEEAIKKWLINSSDSCPVCRKKIIIN